MHKRKSGLGKLIANKDLLLTVILAFSLLSFFLCLQMIPGRASGGMHAFLRASAMLLFLCMPSFFYLHFTDSREDAVLGHLPRRDFLWRVLIFLLGAVCLGVFAGRLVALIGAGKWFSFSSFAFYKDFSLPSFGAFLTYSFATSFLPFGVLHARLSSASAASAILSMALVYAALGFSIFGAPLLFLFGCFLAILRIQSASFFATFFCNIAFLLGAYGERVGFWDALTSSVPAWMCLAIAGGVGGLFLLSSVDFRFFGSSAKANGCVKRRWTPWFFISLLLLGAVLFATLVWGK